MHSCHTCKASGCPATLNRRGFLAGVARPSAAAEMGVLDFASSLFAADPTRRRQAGRACRVHPPGGAGCRELAGRKLRRRRATGPVHENPREAAAQLGVQLDVQAKPMSKPEEVGRFLTQIKKTPPDGLIVCAMELTLWPLVDQVVQNRGDIPTIVYSNLSGFTANLQCRPQRAEDLPRRHAGRRLAGVCPADAQYRSGR